MNTQVSSDTTYEPNGLLDSLKTILGLKNDAELSRALEVAPPMISKIRHRRLPISGALLIRIHEVSDLSVSDLQGMMGDRRAKYRFSSSKGKPKV
ncbi:bacteriophage CI repressor [Duganella aceris]|uniref:Bacteriophage CI repressor n=1 Tax=Duganella aceris TaxID=2703883 RepID=A0ABX0FR67_9BURK|nr:bacteriophage CI repressor [Duganella aceris]NGZ86927.1 bacteriophage CI repressor [Duganella aceris]